MTAALTPWARPPLRGLRVGVAITASDRAGVDAVCRSMMAPRMIKRVERAQWRQRGGGSQGGEECGGEVAAMLLSVGLGSVEMFVLRQIWQGRGVHGHAVGHVGPQQHQVVRKIKELVPVLCT